MEAFFKKIAYTGVGILSLSTLKIKEIVEELIRDRKITEEEGKRLVDDFLAKTKNQRQDLEEQVRAISSIFNKKPEAGPEMEQAYQQSMHESHQQTIQELKAQVKQLENQLQTLSQGVSAKNQRGNPQPQGRESMEEDPMQQPKGRAAGQQKTSPEQQENTLEQQHGKSPADSPENDPINKVKENKRLSFADEVLSPEKKMEAEKQRIQEKQERPAASRKEQDTQKTNLGGPLLTPEKKVARDRQQDEEQ